MRKWEKLDAIEQLDYIVETMDYNNFVNELRCYLSYDELKDLVEHIASMYDVDYWYNQD